MVAKKVFIIAGHDIDGDSGAVYGSYRENEETVQIAERLNRILKDYDIEVFVDPYTNDMADSVRFVNNRCSGLDDGIAIDIHKNSAGVVAHGFETWIMRNSDDKTVRLANLIQNESIKATDLVNRGVKNENWYVITNVKCRGVLIEAGFINGDPNSDEYDEKYAQGIANGVLAFFGIEKKVKETTNNSTQPQISNVAQLNMLPSGIEIRFNKDARLWNYDFAKYPDAKPANNKIYAKGSTANVVAIAKNKLGSEYYVAQASVNNKTPYGFNIKDADVVVVEPVKPKEPEIITPKPEDTKPEVPTVPETPKYEIPKEVEETNAVVKENNAILKAIMEFINWIKKTIFNR